MGDVSEIRILLVAGCLIGIFAYLLVTMPQPLLPASERETASITYPDGWESGDLLYLSETWNSTSISNTTDVEFVLGGRTHRLVGSETATNGPSIILFEYWYSWDLGPIKMFYKLEPCDWLDSTGYYVDADFQNALLMESLDNSSYSPDERFIGRWTEHSQFKAYIIFNFNQTAYPTWESAMDDGALNMWIGVQFDQTNTAYNSWDIVGMILFFNMPDIDPFLNAIIAVPVWIAIAYVSFILILRAIGAIFGGGGA